MIDTNGTAELTDRTIEGPTTFSFKVEGRDIEYEVRSKREETLQTGLVALAYLVFTPLTLWIEGVLIAYLWRSFIATPFHLPEIGVWHATGIALMVSFMTHQSYPKHQESAKDLATRLAGVAFLTPIMALGCGLFIKWMSGL